MCANGETPETDEYRSTKCAASFWLASFGHCFDLFPLQLAEKVTVEIPTSLKTAT